MRAAYLLLTIAPLISACEAPRPAATPVVPPSPAQVQLQREEALIVLARAGTPETRSAILYAARSNVDEGRSASAIETAERNQQARTLELLREADRIARGVEMRSGIRIAPYSEAEVRPFVTARSTARVGSDAARRDAALVAAARDRAPDLDARIRSAAEANVDERLPAGRQTRAMRDRAVREELARIDRLLTEQRDAERRSLEAVQDRNMRDQQAMAICRARAAQVEMTQPQRGLLNLEATATGARFGQICWDTYRATGVMPSY